MCQQNMGHTFDASENFLCLIKSLTLLKHAQGEIERKKKGRNSKLLAQKPCSDAVCSRATSPMIQTEKDVTCVADEGGMNERNSRGTKGRREKPHKCNRFLLKTAPL